MSLFSKTRKPKIALALTISFAFTLIGFTLYALAQLPQGFKGL